MADISHGGVAIIDDDPAVLDSLKFLLEVTGHTVGAYASATAFLADREAHPDCLILDQHMPAMTGLELAERLRAAGGHIPVLLITAGLSPAMLAHAGALGISEVLEKPFAADALLHFVDAHA
jgi:two-component system response regulator FixJ